MVISPDSSHDRHFTLYCQTQISEYLKSISADIKIMPEFTDGCSAQYKNRNFMGNVSRIHGELGYSKIIRNFYETSHAKGGISSAYRNTRRLYIPDCGILSLLSTKSKKSFAFWIISLPLRTAISAWCLRNPPAACVNPLSPCNIRIRPS
jgi:hypothetical protein